LSSSLRETWVAAQDQLINSLGLEKGEARQEAQLLLQAAANKNRAWLLAHENEALNCSMAQIFQPLLLRRLQGEPIAYILGCREFYGLNLMVSRDTLIPRPDTETLVEAALAKISPQSHVTILDLGTGSGAIALALATQRPLAQVIASDASSAALKIAEINAQSLAISNVVFVLSDWYAQLPQQQFDLIVSNPPYVEINDVHLKQGDLRFEPLNALASGIDGLDDIRRIIEHSLIYLKPQGWLLLEHGFHQARLVADLMAEAGLTEIVTLQDLGGNNRVTLAKNPLIVSTHWG